MTKIFLDANVLVAVLNKEYPVFSDAARVISLNENKNIQIFTSAVCLTIAFYFAEKKSGNLLARKKIKLLLEHIYVSKADEEVVTQAIKNPMIHDFEDGIEYYSAIYSDCKYIVTENIKDFYFSEIPVMDCASFLRQFMIDKY